MKCIQCGSNTPGGKARQSGRCGSCSHAFAFLGLPSQFGFTDGTFYKAIEAVSAKDTLFFTERQLWYEVLRRVPKAPGPGCGAKAGMVLLTPLWLLMGAVGDASGAPAEPRVSFDLFKTNLLDRWVSTHGAIAHLVSTPAARARSAAPPPEVLNYSFDRALVVDNADLAAMLVANRFHFENNCAILSADRRYPAGQTFETVKAMLSRNPNLIVLAAHDASAQGARLAAQLRADDWFPDFTIRIADLGLTPRQAWGAKIPPIPSVAVSASEIPLPTDEANWLAAGNRAELSALRPQRMMKVLYHGMARVREALTGDGYWDDSGIWIVGYDYTPGGVWIHDTAYPDYWAPGGTDAIGDAGAPDSFG